MEKNTLAPVIMQNCDKLPFIIIAWSFGFLRCQTIQTLLSKPINICSKKQMYFFEENFTYEFWPKGLKYYAAGGIKKIL